MFSFVKRAAAKLNRHLGMSIERTYLYRLSRTDGWSPAVSVGPLKWELLSPGQVGKLAEIGWFDEREGVERLQRGDRCYTISIDGCLAHYSWVQRSSSHSITEAGVSVPVGDGAFWIYHCQTAEWARGRGLYPSTLERIVHDCFAEGDFTAWIYTAKHNVASQKGILRAGFGLVTTLRAFRMGSQYFPIGGGRDTVLAALQSTGHRQPERKRDPQPAFLSAPAAEHRRGPASARWDRTPVRRAEPINGREPATRSEL